MKVSHLLLLALGCAITTAVGAPSLAGTGDLFDGWPQFTVDSPPVVALINTQDIAELRDLVRQAGGGAVLRRKLDPGERAIPAGLKKVLQLRDRVEELSGRGCLLVHYTQITRRDLEMPNVRAIVFTAWKPREDKLHEQEMAELIKLTTKPFIGFCGGHHFLYQTFGGKTGSLRKLAPGEKDPAPTYCPGYLKEWGNLKVRIVQRDPLFEGLPDEMVLPQRHAAECKLLPAELVLLASSDDCKVQAIKHRHKALYGTQFHPEMYDDGHPHGKILLRNFFRMAGLGPRPATANPAKHPKPQ